MSDREESKKAAKKPKIVQFATNGSGFITTILYSDGRIFIWNWTKLPDTFSANPYGEGSWGELQYPPLNS
jgi:hypothetical protein